MSDINKIVAAIISTARSYPSVGATSVEVRVQDYQDCLKAVSALEGHKEPADLDLNAVKTAVVEALDRALARK